MRNVKAAFFDIDSTLFDYKNDCWDLKSIEKIKELKKKGIKVFICTARPYHSFKWLGALDLGVEWDGFIASSGGYAYADGKYIYVTKMEDDDVRNFIALALKRNLTLELVELEDRKLVAPLTKEAEDHYSHFKECIPPVKSYEGEDVEGLNFFALEDEDEIFMERFPHLVFYRYSPSSVDVMPVPHEKGKCVRMILDYYGFKKDEAIGFGDDMQDLSMAENVGYFVCMGNGKDEVKKAANFVTKNVWEGGVGYAIETILENN